MDLKTTALQIAQTQVGQTEKPLGSNWGMPVQNYLASVGINFPASWCMAFMYYCFDHAALQLGVTNPLFKTGGVLAQYNNRRANLVAIDPLKPLQDQLLPGDIFIMRMEGGEGHTGIIENLNGDTIHTIEGNTNNNGSREGTAVERKIRYNKPPIIAFLRF